MLDRHVCQTEPQPESGDGIGPFSVHIAKRNIILLGDPGAGKTELFKQAAVASGGEFLTVRRFLNTPIERLPHDKALWIDALDETRSGRGDQNTVDRVVDKLETLQPVAVRLSCRAADWLGKSDLAAFEGYFEHNGGAPVVVQLQPLSEREQQDILSRKEVEDPTTFLAEARRRGLDAMLTNPQTLLMLAKAVRGQQWPATRSELFEQAAAILLQEHNDEHGERGTGQYTAHELLTAAGALCALRLVSDFEGFCLRSNSDDDEVPSYRVIDLAPPEILRSTLTRRVFVSTGTPDVVDYAHRTLAEYLGARWLAERIRQGLPLGRVQSLLGVDGHPASSLRGLHAWMAALSPDSAPILIDADPMGIVMYADATQLSASDKNRLMTALTRHAERDPWFYRGHHAAYGVGALTDSCMADTFRALLHSASTPFSIRMLVVDAQKYGQPLQELHNDMRLVLVDPNAPYALRDGCLDVLCAMGEAGAKTVLALYPTLGSDEEGLQLRITAMAVLYGHGLQADAFAQLIDEIVGSTFDLPIGATYDLGRVVPGTHAADLLDRLDFTARIPDHGYSHRKSKDISRIYEGLLVKAIEQTPLPENQHLYSWLCVLLRYSREYGLAGSLKETLKKRQDHVVLLLDACIECFVVDDAQRGKWYGLQRMFSPMLSGHLLLDRLQHALGRFGENKDVFILEKMLGICLSEPGMYTDVFWYLCDYAGRSDALIQIRDKYCIEPVEDWRLQDAEDRLRRKEEDDDNRQEALSHFDEHRVQIASGVHLGWMGDIAEHYFGFYDTSELSLEPMARLHEFFGDERIDIVLTGLNALIENRRTVQLSEIISLHLGKKLCRWWYAVLAGLDLLSADDINDAELTDDYLASAIAIACLLPVYRHEGNTTHTWEHAWLQHAIRFRPDLVRQTFFAIVETDLATGERHPEGLRELQDPALAGLQRGLLVEKLLMRFPKMHCDALEKLLRMAAEDEIWPRLQAATAAGIAAETGSDSNHMNERQETRRMWLAFGFLTEPEQYRSQIEALSGDDAVAMVWPLLNMGSLNRHQNHDFGFYSLRQLEFVAHYAAVRYPFTPIPIGLIRGVENAWDVSHAIVNILTSISVNTDDTSRDALLRLSEDPALESYSKQAKHLLAQQQVRRIDAAHRLPIWRSAMMTLANRSPSSAQDLHALVLAHLHEVCRHIAHANTDPYKHFWNTARHDKIDSPKSEELARDTLIELLRPRLHPMGLRVEPEGHMARDKRADIVVFSPGLKCVIELKRDYHREVWTAATTQLERLYTRDPEASGYGIYGVFWYGEKRKNKIPLPPSGCLRPDTSLDMQRILESTLPEHLQHKIKVVVFDVSGEILSE